MGKQFDTNQLIARRTKAIYDRLGAGFLIMGNQSSGSYNLSDNKQTFHSRLIESDRDLIVEPINKDLIPQLLALNGLRLSDKDMPKLVPGDIGDPDIESNSKMIQRTVAVGAIPLTPEVQNEMLKMCGFKYRIPETIVTDEQAYQDFISKYGTTNTSRSGDGLSSATGGLNGTGDSVSDNDNSSLNVENAS